MTTDKQDKQRLIDRFQLAPHPEGGHYRETHRDSQRVSRIPEPGRSDAEVADASRAASTCIYYMLCDGAYSAWHRIRSDEVWHFYAGDPIDVHVIDVTGRLATYRLGNALTHADASFQVVVPAGCWFAAECAALYDSAARADFALVGCTVAPGFEFRDFELADVEALAAQFPSHAALLRRLAPRSHT
ncbi:cupin domain-containing protein [Trinickia diaoshuihuensis]|jgi:predicted cupin superfamily sugar epimerase|uniref:cupin domain-containing protein n=1 Tax=Trinickia diaoshuihuensis TaxID=2292265 RepID=UPI000E245ADD|nr:cupin domain-containing protein [Trinickia diaoshuihuensis]